MSYYEAAKQAAQRLAQQKSTRKAAKQAALEVGGRLAEGRQDGKKRGLLSSLVSAGVTVGVEVLGVGGVIAVGTVVLLVVAGLVAALFVGGMIAVAFSVSDYEAGLGLVVLDDVAGVAADAYILSAETARADLGCNLPAEVLAAVGFVESGHGGGRLDPAGTADPPIYGPTLDGSDGVMLIEDTDGGALDEDDVYDRAVGPMQFIPQTWDGLGRDGDGDGSPNPQNIYDSALSAAWYLCDGRALDLTDSETLGQRLFAYNRSTEYVALVMGHVGRYRMLTAALGRPSTTPDVLLNTTGFSASANARADLESGNVDPRLVKLLSVITASWRIHVRVLHTGHSRCVSGTDCVESHHYHWRAADITSVSARADYDTLRHLTRRGLIAPSATGVAYDNPEARGLVEALAALPVTSSLRPDQVGSPWPQFDPLAGFFSDAGHQGHIHVAVCGPRSVRGTVTDTCEL